ncbi:SDR family NAD(P)-dependent oxidoreductase, partial [Mycobacterium sp. NPDC003449]
MLWRYDGRRVVVTGCASGIGAHLAAQLAELGARVTGLDRREPDSPPVEFVEVDLAEPASVGGGGGPGGGAGGARVLVGGGGVGVGVLG